MKVKKFLLVFIYFILMFVFSFSAIVKARDGNVVRVDILKISGGIVKMKGFFGVVDVPVDNISYIVFDEKENVTSGIKVGDKIYSGSIFEYDATSAVITLNIGEISLKDVKYIKYWNVENPNYDSIEWMRSKSTEYVNFYMGDNYTKLLGKIVDAKENIIYTYIPVLGEGVVKLDNINVMKFEDTDVSTSMMLKLHNGYELKIKKLLRKVNDYFTFDIGYGEISIIDRAIAAITGKSIPPENPDTYFVLKNGIRFFGELINSEDKEYSVRSVFGEHKIPASEVITFLKIPTQHLAVFLSNDFIALGKYSYNEGKLIFEPTENLKLTSILLAKVPKEFVFHKVKELWKVENIEEFKLNNEKNLIAAYAPSMFIFLSISNGEVVDTYKLNNEITSFAFSDEKSLLFVDKDKKLYELDITKKKLKQLTKFKEDIKVLKKIKDRVFFVSKEGTVMIYDIQKNKFTEVFSNGGRILGIKNSDNNIYIATNDGMVQGITSLKPMISWKTNFKINISDFEVMDKTDLLILSDNDGKLYFIDGKTGKEIKTVELNVKVRKLNKIPETNYLIVVSEGKVIILDTVKGIKVAEEDMNTEKIVNTENGISGELYVLDSDKILRAVKIATEK